MFNKINTKKIDKYLNKYFPIIYEFKFNGLILLLGGVIKNISMNKDSKDIDFVLLTDQKDNIEDFINKFDLQYTMNAFNGYKIHYNGLEIDIFAVNDLFKAGHYNTDYLFYDINRRELIPISINYSIKNNEIIEVNDFYLNTKRERARLKKQKQFINFLNDNNKKIKVKYAHNQLIVLFKRFIKNPKKAFKKLFGGDWQC